MAVHVLLEYSEHTITGRRKTNVHILITVLHIYYVNQITHLYLKQVCTAFKRGVCMCEIYYVTRYQRYRARIRDDVILYYTCFVHSSMYNANTSNFSPHPLKIFVTSTNYKTKMSYLRTYFQKLKYSWYSHFMPRPLKTYFLSLQHPIQFNRP